MLAPNSVPTLTVGGFLGAGKTTLVNRLLSQSDGQRIVVFVNDFGAINIDHDLVETVEEDRIALSNGCVCCSLNDDLVRSMVEFCENDCPDVFAIEASGVADPKALALTLQALQAAGQAHLQSRLYVLDAAYFGSLDYADTEDLIDHAAASDLILINKCDLVPETRIAEIDRILARSAPGAVRMATTHAQMSWSDAMRSGANANMDFDISAVPRRAHSQFTTASFNNIPTLSETQLSTLVQMMQGSCLRAKGFLRLKDKQQSVKRFQLVGRNVDLISVPESNAPQSQLVIIGWSKTLPVQQVSSILGIKPSPSAR